jgi:CRISPR/Cas system CSM-associated protein Csm3 (group 7 of RAMP superfamily)
LGIIRVNKLETCKSEHVVCMGNNLDQCRQCRIFSPSEETGGERKRVLKPAGWVTRKVIFYM